MTWLMQPERGFGVVIIFRMSSIRIYPSLSLYSIIYPNWFLLLLILLIFTARNSSVEKVMLSQACVSHSVHRGWVSLVPCPFWGWISLVSSPFQGMSMSRGMGMSWGRVYDQGWVCLGCGYIQGVSKSIGWVFPGVCGYVQGWVPTLPPPRDLDQRGRLDSHPSY